MKEMRNAYNILDGKSEVSDEWPITFIWVILWFSGGLF
jgi:hypothetical protein